MNDYKDKKDGTLVEMTLLGDDRAYETLVTRHQRSVMGTAYKVTGNEFSAEDASQDAFVSAWVNLNSLRDGEKFGSWVCSIAKNCARSVVIHYQNAVADISLNLIENMELASSDESGLSELLSGNYSEAERDEKLHAAVEALSEKIRETVKLHYFEGLSVEKIAKKLSLPAGTVKWRLSEGRRQLRKEYGIMEKGYDENKTLVERVMQQVEQLKLWMLKNDKTGFEQEYRVVLASVEALDESHDKQHALADVLMRGYWWLPEKKNDEMFARIKKAAEESINEDVMQDVLSVEWRKMPRSRTIEGLTQKTKELEEKGFRKALAYAWFWMGVEYLNKGDLENCTKANEKVLELLSPADVYYANAKAALGVNERYLKARTEAPVYIHATGEVYRYINGKLYFWHQPGYQRGDLYNAELALFWNCGQCDRLIYDPDMEEGDVCVSSDQKNKLTLKQKGISVTTPAGVFENCAVTVFEGDYYGLKYAETYFCPEVGIVRQLVERRNGLMEWVLSKYNICGGEGIVPFAAGNRWEYQCLTGEDDAMILSNRESVFEVTAYENGAATVFHHGFVKCEGYRDTWCGNMTRAQKEYCDARETNSKLHDVAPYMRRAAELASTKREKLHTEIATDVMNRIFAGDPDFTSDGTEQGRWDFFNYYHVKRENGTVTLPDHGRKYAFEWKVDPWNVGAEGYKVLWNFLYDILDEQAGCVWSDAWVTGYRMDEDRNSWGTPCHIVFDVLEDESVTTPAGTFEGCRHISYDYQGLTGGSAYRGGKKEYWFAPGVGIVKMRGLYWKDTKEAIWELTEYRGTGEGYFPTGDGFFRRYEPRNLGNGWHGSVEYTFDEDETGMIVFRNALGTQERANYEADVAERKRKEEEKKAKEAAEKAAKQEETK